MSFKSFANDTLISKYITEHSLRQTKEQQQLQEATLNHPRFIMLGAPESLQLNANLMKLIGAKKILDVGVYTGASSLSAALAIPQDGEIYALDITDEYYEIGKPFIQQAGIDHKIKLILGPASESLAKLMEDGHSGSFDFAFIDADKQNIDTYYESCLALIRSGGIIAIDNTIWGGQVIDQTDQSEATTCLRKLNLKLKDDQRINLSFLQTGDGLTLCFKK